MNAVPRILVVLCAQSLPSRPLPPTKSFFFTCYTSPGGERGPVTSPAFKAGDSVLSGPNGGFDFHTPPPRRTHFQEVRNGSVGSPNTRCSTFRRHPAIGAPGLFCQGCARSVPLALDTPLPPVFYKS